MGAQALPSVLVGLLLVLAGLTTVANVRARGERRREALYLVGRVAGRHHLALCAEPLSIELDWDDRPVTIHYYLHGAHEGDDSIVLRSRRPSGSRLGNLVAHSDVTRIIPGMTRIVLGPDFDPYFRISCAPERADLVAARLLGHPAFAAALRSLTSRTRSCRVELADLDDHFQISYLDRRIRFPSLVEDVTLDFLRLLPTYRQLAGDERWPESA